MFRVVQLEQKNCQMEIEGRRMEGLFKEMKLRSDRHSTRDVIWSLGNFMVQLIAGHKFTLYYVWSQLSEQLVNLVIFPILYLVTTVLPGHIFISGNIFISGHLVTSGHIFLSGNLFISGHIHIWSPIHKWSHIHIWSLIHSWSLIRIWSPIHIWSYINIWTHIQSYLVTYWYLVTFC